ncbi:MAG: ABC transporter substrate-binding protein [Clostridiales bacterium]|nr:ABC transporter substrate-binding protein [Clostridiales bacterium]
MKKFLCAVLSMLLLLSCTALAEEAVLTAAAPNGAPALALAMLAIEKPENFTFVAAETISAEFAKQEADFIIAPLNAGAKLYKMGKSTYKLAGVVSWGNLFFASQKEGFQVEDINGATITIFGENTINASVVKYALEQNGIVPDRIEYLASAVNTQSLLLADASAIVVTAEPALTAAKIKNPAVTGYALNELYKAATGYDGYTQAALFVKADTADAQPEAVKAFIQAVAASCETASTDLEALATAAVTLEILPNQKVAMAAIPGCAIRFVGALEAKEQVEATANIDLVQFGGAVPADDFYYVAE